jgi:LAO/AO transport system kinase
MSKKKQLEDLMRKKVREGRINCSSLRKIAEEAGVSYRLAGNAADKLKIKIRKCDFGCF